MADTANDKNNNNNDDNDNDNDVIEEEETTTTTTKKTSQWRKTRSTKVSNRNLQINLNSQLTHPDI